MLLEKVFYLGRFVGGEIVQNDVDLLLALAFTDDLLEEGNEFVTGVSGRRFAVKLARFHV
jgi:hypothetical protein